jgi:hypothetical protein
VSLAAPPAVEARPETFRAWTIGDCGSPEITEAILTLEALSPVTRAYVPALLKTRALAPGMLATLASAPPANGAWKTSPFASRNKAIPETQDEAVAMKAGLRPEAEIVAAPTIDAPGSP